MSTHRTSPAGGLSAGWLAGALRPRHMIHRTGRPPARK